MKNEKIRSLFLYIIYKKYAPKRIDDNKKEYFAKLFRDRAIIVIGNKIFRFFFESLLEKLFKKTKIIRVEIQKINCGFIELTKKNVIGQINIKIKKIFFFLLNSGTKDKIAIV